MCLFEFFLLSQQLVSFEAELAAFVCEVLCRPAVIDHCRFFHRLMSNVACHLFMLDAKIPAATAVACNLFNSFMLLALAC